LTFFVKKIAGETPILYGVWASKTYRFCGACKKFGALHPLWAEIWSSEKVDLGGYDFPCRSPVSGPKFTQLHRLTREELL